LSQNTVLSLPKSNAAFILYAETMKDNWETCLCLGNIALVPYRKCYVDIYHGKGACIL